MQEGIKASSFHFPSHYANIIGYENPLPLHDIYYHISHHWLEEMQIKKKNITRQLAPEIFSVLGKFNKLCLVIM